MQAGIQEGLEFSEMNIVYVRLEQQYQAFNELERTVADEVVNQWLASGDEDHWDVAVALADVFRLESALPSLQILLSRLRREIGPGAPFDVARVERLIAKLSAKNG